MSVCCVCDGPMYMSNFKLDQGGCDRGVVWGKTLNAVSHAVGHGEERDTRSSTASVQSLLRHALAPPQQNEFHMTVGTTAAPKPGLRRSEPTAPSDRELTVGGKVSGTSRRSQKASSCSVSMTHAA